jgi:hypothetical protein
VKRKKCRFLGSRNRVPSDKIITSNKFFCCEAQDLSGPSHPVRAINPALKLWRARYANALCAEPQANCHLQDVFAPKPSSHRLNVKDVRPAATAQVQFAAKKSNWNADKFIGSSNMNVLKKLSLLAFLLKVAYDYSNGVYFNTVSVNCQETIMTMC